MKIIISIILFINLFGYEIDRIEKELKIENIELNKKIKINKKNIDKLKKENIKMSQQIQKNRQVIYRIKNIETKKNATVKPINKNDNENPLYRMLQGNKEKL